jgi:hypothetical protein
MANPVKASVIKVGAVYGRGRLVATDDTLAVDHEPVGSD